MNWLRKFAEKLPSKSLRQPAKNVKLISNIKRKDSTCDFIGPADKISNLRGYKYYIPNNESKCEYNYRKLREEVNEFNHQYWTEQNLKFIEARRKFSEKKRMERQFLNRENAFTSPEFEPIDTDPNSKNMNEFYKEFLNDNYQNHYEYNKKWFNYNFALLIPAIRVYFYRLRNKNRDISKQLE